MLKLQLNAHNDVSRYGVNNVCCHQSTVEEWKLFCRYLVINNYWTRFSCHGIAKAV